MYRRAPPIVLVTESIYTLLRNPDVFPYFLGFIVGVVDGNVKLFLWKI
jgi:hypothetical protein